LSIRRCAAEFAAAALLSRTAAIAASGKNRYNAALSLNNP